MRKDWLLQYYCVAYIDILGQSDKILSLNKLPQNEEEKNIASDILYDTAGNVLNLRTYIQSFFKNRKKSTGILDSLPLDKREKAEIARSIEVKTTSISDTIIISIPINRDYEHCVSMGSIYSTLYGISSMFLTGLAYHIPMRGSIEIGLGVPITKKEIYGEALVKTYNLEKNSADYPRIVIGNSLGEYLSSIHNQVPNSEFGILAKKWAKDSKSFIVDDKDGLKILDVIGNEFKSISCELKNEELVQKAYSFIFESHEYFKKIGDVKLSKRYSQLRNYFESKLASWNIQLKK